MEHARQCSIGPEISPAGDFLDAIRTDWPGADDFEAAHIGFGCHDRFVPL
jgi:hypothetical protein